MPFTFSHPAIVLPFINKRGKYLSGTGLVVGSMAPDFETFLKFGDEKIYSHTWLGLFWFDWPLALVLTFVFHLFVKGPLIDHLPAGLRNRLNSLRELDWLDYCKKHPFVVIYSLFIGVFSHLIWDAVTHLNLYYADSITSNVKVFGHRLYIFLQYFCSLAGALYIIFYVKRMPLTHNPRPQNKIFKYWLYILLLTFFGLSYFLTKPEQDEYVDSIYVINLTISCALAALLLVSITVRFLIRSQSKH